MLSTLLRTAITALVAGVFVITAPSASASPEDVMTITFVRHGESAGNASGTIDTSVPGPTLTFEGDQQAKAVADWLSRTGPDGVYASTMVRTQQTAQYLADELGEPVVVLPGLREVEAGEYEGQPADVAGPAMFDVIGEWLSGDLYARIPGSVDGNDVMERFGGAVRTIYASGDRRQVAFSHGAAIAVWTLMTVSNPQFELFQDQPLPNTGYVVVQGNPALGWRLIDWNGTKVD